MKSTFTAKYLQHLTSKKKNNEGFTLIELLVVIIIVGVLAAIALPSFLNQIGKARGSEAKSTLGTINRSQQAYRLENNTFATATGTLDARITEKFYNVGVTAAGVNTTFAAHTAAAVNGDLKSYGSAVSQAADGTSFSQIVCETEANTQTAPAVTSTAAGHCATLNSKSVE
ncbi:Type II secretion system protein G [Acaryochloris thomasi RCC1774]|uniref:Type II secretion system protein G n=1 Tax=Acaryochloris thomasi RCC1774 TaxID=1764569 RepID=A0A2W1JNN1_9CYAN|nr:type IV pilin-like G/H family protein [Acaryochloris thomasi]PZD72482.1 Type II secretion system protein G [Acaryochloris thomasi RCC1774]